jgi:hypothetical protein
MWHLKALPVVSASESSHRWMGFFAGRLSSRIKALNRVPGVLQQHVPNDITLEFFT